MFRSSCVRVRFIYFRSFFSLVRPSRCSARNRQTRIQQEKKKKTVIKKRNNNSNNNNRDRPQSRFCIEKIFILPLAYITSCTFTTYLPPSRPRFVRRPSELRSLTADSLRARVLRDGPRRRAVVVAVRSNTVRIGPFFFRVIFHLKLRFKPLVRFR